MRTGQLDQSLDPDPGAPSLLPLARRFGREDLSAFDSETARRFLARASGGPADGNSGLPDNLNWELLYRLEPGLYEALIAGESVHPGVFEFLPERAARAVEIGAGTGRFTLALAPRCDRLLAIEPARPMAARLRVNLRSAAIGHVTVKAGFFDSIPAPDESADLMIAYSAFDTDPAHGGVAGLAEMDRVTARGGSVVLVTSVDPDWLTGQGFEVSELPEGPAVHFANPQQALEMTRIFYPWAAERVERSGAARVPRRLIHPFPLRVAVRSKP